MVCSLLRATRLRVTLNWCPSRASVALNAQLLLPFVGGRGGGGGGGGGEGDFIYRVGSLCSCTHNAFNPHVKVDRIAWNNLAITRQ